MNKMLSSSLRSCLFVCLILFSNLSAASFYKNIWPQWGVHNPLSKHVISHQEWQEFLSRCVITNDEGINLIDYPHLTEADLETLRHYINRMSKLDLRKYNRNEQLAYWINLYNALVVRMVAEYYPIDTIQEINVSPGLFSVGPWGANVVTVDGTKLSLDDIQNRIVRAIWNDPRTHYALNDGCIGAANLSKQAFQGSTIDAQLHQAAYEYINSLRCIQVIDNKLIVSKIYEWYLEDFGGSQVNLIHHLSQYAEAPLLNDLKHLNSVNSYIYNWHLNSAIASTS